MISVTYVGGPLAGMVSTFPTAPPDLRLIQHPYQAMVTKNRKANSTRIMCHYVLGQNSTYATSFVYVYQGESDEPYRKLRRRRRKPARPVDEFA